LALPVVGNAGLGAPHESPLIRVLGPHGAPIVGKHLRRGQVDEGVALVGFLPEIHCEVEETIMLAWPITWRTKCQE
jgi:hypothetical protein